MTDFNYKKYSLEQLENWMHDAMSSDATPDEIYDVIVKVVRDNYYHYKQQASFAYELLTKFNQRPDKCIDDVYEAAIKEREYYEPSWVEGNAKVKVKTHQEMIGEGWEMTDDGFWIKEDKVTKWVLPVEQIHDDYFVSFPDDLLEAANLKEGDQVEWIDRGDESYTLKKVEV